MYIGQGLPTQVAMCGRVIQSSEPLRLAIVDGLDLTDRRMRNLGPATMLRRAKNCGLFGKTIRPASDLSI
jgi:hypothetical protein